MRLADRSILGSALRLSQPLSGFLAGQSCVALFHATTVPGILPSELFPHKDRAPLSRSLAPLQLSTAVLKCAGLRLSSLVSPTSTLSRSCLDPHNDYGLRFHEPRPVSPPSWALLSGITSFRQLHLLRSFPPLVRPYPQLRVAPPLPAVSLLVFLPLRSFLLPRLGFSTHPWPRGPGLTPSSEDSGVRLRGPVTPVAG